MAINAIFLIFLVLNTVLLVKVSAQNKTDSPICQDLKPSDRPVRNFHRLVFAPNVPLCGDPDYLDFHRCLVAKNEWTTQKHTFDKVLAMVSGCMVCNGAGEEATATVHLEFHMPAGSLFTKCNDKWEKVDTKKVKLAKSNVNYTRFGADFFAGFSIGGKVEQRHCMGLFSEDDLLEKFDAAQLRVEDHKCGDGKERTIKLPEVVANLYNDHQPEMVGIKIELDEENSAQQQSQLEYVHPKGEKSKKADWKPKFSTDFHWGNLFDGTW